jgi:hypothetical protein
LRERIVLLNDRVLPLNVGVTIGAGGFEGKQRKNRGKYPAYADPVWSSLLCPRPPI